MTNIYATREAWLDAAQSELKRMFFVPAEKDLPDTVRIGVGWSKGAKKNSVGWCYKPESADDGSTHIFVSPVLVEPMEILPVLLHELIHAHDRNESKHAGNFRRTWAQFGFVGKPTASSPGLELTDRLRPLAELLGDYPHAKLNPFEKVKTQTTRMLKIACTDAGCGCIVRMTKKWVEEVGPPVCGCGAEMELSEE